MKKRVIIDCDPGLDDFLAIGMAAFSDSIEIHSITTVAGNKSIDQVTDNALRAISYFELTNVPVFKGSEKPLALGRMDSGYVFGEDGLLGLASSIQLENEPENIDAAQHILDSVASGKIDCLVAIGPLTNIARAFKKNKGIMNSLDRIVVMGGAIQSKGNITPFAEFNFFTDPHAADYVLRNAENLCLIPLDVTSMITLDQDELAIPLHVETISLLDRMILKGIEKSQKIGQSGLMIHDALAIGALIHDDFLTFDYKPLKVSTTELDRGACLDSARTPGVVYASALGTRSFKEYFVDFLSRVKTAKATEISNP